MPRAPMERCANSRCALLELPRDVLERVVGYLDVQAARRLGSTCHLLHALSQEAVPGLRLSLYPHQARPDPTPWRCRHS